MIDATSLKTGAAFLNEGKPYVVSKYEHIKIGRGGAKIKVVARNLSTGNLSEFTFTPNNKFEEISTSRRRFQYLYTTGGDACFMDSETYDQIEVPLDVLGDDIHFMQEGENVDLVVWKTDEGDKVLSAEIPPNVVLEVLESEPGVKGNSATNIYKPVKLANSLEVKVPLFINKGDRVRIDTRTREYIERVNS